MPFDGFMWIKGGSSGAPNVVGETLDEVYKKEKAFSIKSFQVGVENKTSIGTAGGGAGTGKATLREFQVEKFTDNCSPSLFKTCACGAHYNQAFIAVRKAGARTSKGAGVEYLLYEFREVFVIDIDWNGSSEDDLPVETVKFAYGAMKIQYQAQGPDGKPKGSPNVQQWNQVLNTDSTIEVNL